MQKQDSHQIRGKESLLKQLQQTKKQLFQSIKQQSRFSQNLCAICMQLSHLMIEDYPKVETLMYDLLKPLSREIVNYNPKLLTTVRQMKSVIFKIVEICCRIFVRVGNTGALDLIKELIFRDNRLFSKGSNQKSAAAPPICPSNTTASERDGSLMQTQPKRAQKQEQDQKQKVYKWAKGRIGYTTLHRDCCQLIYNQLNYLPQKLETMKLSAIKQLLNFIYSLQDFIFDEYIYTFALSSFSSLTHIINKPSKQNVRQATKEVFEDISQKLLRLLYYYSDKEVKRDISLLGPQFGVNLLNSQYSNLENKLNGLRILQKFANSFYYKCPQYVKDQFFAQWLIKNNLWNLLINRTADTTMVQASEYILKLIINKGKVPLDKFDNFLNIIWEVKTDVRIAYLKSLDPIRLPSNHISLAIQNFSNIQQNTQLYVQEFFTQIQNFARYCAYAKTKTAIADLLLCLLKKHFFNFKQYSLKRKALDAFKYCFQKHVDNDKEFSQKIQAYVCVFSEFINEPNYLTLSIARRIFESEQKKNSYVLQKAAKQLIQSNKIIQTIIKHMQQPITYKEELMYFLKAILTKYKNYNMSNSISISEQILLMSIGYPQIFTQLINFCPNYDCEKLFVKILQILQQEQINFACVRQLFYKVNYLFVDVLIGEYFRPNEYLIKCDPSQLKFIKQLYFVLQRSGFPNVQQKCAELIADIHTCFSEVYVESGKKKTRQFMQLLVSQAEKITLNQDFLAIKENQTFLYGKLCLIREMLSATEVHGVGNLKAHNSLITTSMIKVKIWNNASYGDDVQKCYEKTVPSNLTVFDLLSKIGEKFKCGQHELYLQEGNNSSVPLKMNGHTLLQIGFSNFKEFNAYKNTKVQVKKQLLKIDNQLNPKFLTILKGIFKNYSIEGKMGEKEIVEYIYGVTGSPSHKKDLRVTNLLQQYDSDHDGYLVQQDLIRFYEDSCDDGDKQLSIWTNLTNLHYRRDLRRFNQPMTPIQPQSLFRFYLKSSLQSYELLFTLCKSPIVNLSYLAKSILVHLPTCEHFMENSIEQLQFLDKSTFEISYILVNVRYFLERQQQKQQKVDELRQKQYEQFQNSKMQIQDPNQNQRQIYTKYLSNQQEEQSLFSRIDDQSQIPSKQAKNQSINPIERFIENKNDIKIFKLIQELSSKQDRSQQEQVLRVVCINILRTLINFTPLDDNYMRNEKHNVDSLNSIVKKMNALNLQQKDTRFFIQLAKKCLQDNQFTVFQSVLALSLLQPSLQWSPWLQHCIFHPQHQVRKTTMNFLIFFSLKSSFSIYFFSLKVDIVVRNCQQWFLLLFFYANYNKKCDLNLALQKTLCVLDKQRQQIKQNYLNPIMNGNLNLLKILLVQKGSQIDKRTIQQIYSVLEKLVERTLSNDNRMIQYQVMLMLNPDKSMNYLYDLIRTVKPTDKYEIKQNFVGIRNLGSTCYMNSILQQFFTIHSFKDLVLALNINQVPQLSEVSGLHMVDDFLYQLQKMYTYLSQSKKKYYYPKEFCLSIKDYDAKPINTSLQQDAHQFLNNLFGKIQGYFKQNQKLSQLQKIFQGKTICEIICKQCESKIQKIQDFYHLALEVKDLDRLSDSFGKFIAPQVIEDYYCQKCQKKSQQITKQTFLNQTPEMLIINLQRIIFDLNLFQKVKVHSRLQFPQQLDVSPYLHISSSCPSPIYKLKGVVIHSGTSQGGHYYSLIKNNGQWYKFNDQNVSKFSFSDLERQAYGGNSSTDNWGDVQYSTNAYILFYQVQHKQDLGKLLINGRFSQINSSNETIFVSQNGTKRHLSDQISSKLQIIDQKQKDNEFQVRQTQPSQLFLAQVHEQNTKFYKQLQIHQQSYFDFINKIYQSIRPHDIFTEKRDQFFCYQEQWQKLPHLFYLQKLFDICLQVLRFYQTFNCLNKRIFIQTAQTVYELISLLPEKTYLFVNKYIDEKNWVQVMCTHSQIHVRELYKVVLNKVIFVYGNYYGFLLEQSGQNASKSDVVNVQQHNQDRMDGVEDSCRLREILTTFLEATSSDLIAKNIFKSYFFFEFWRVNIQFNAQIYQFCLRNNYLFTLLDLLMGNQSPFTLKDKKRQDFPYQVAVPLVLSILKLIQRKRNLTSNTPFHIQTLSLLLYHNLTEKQSQVLSSMAFYSKMMKFKYDNGVLAGVICFMSYKDKHFSERIAQLFLNGLNKIQQVEDAFSLLNVFLPLNQNIKGFLLIKDEFERDRIRWVLGVAQFQSGGKLSYGLRYSNQSINIAYVSSRYFIADQKYKPTLQVLHDKRTCFTDFQARGILTLLQILNNSQYALKYLLSLPPPSYLYQNYLTWIQEYIQKLQLQQHYGFSVDRKVLVRDMSALFAQLLQKQVTIKAQSPVLKNIIGKNKTLEVEEQLSTQSFHIRRWGHQTYILKNMPVPQMKNQSLPDEQYGIKSAGNQACYFIESCDIKDLGVEVPSQKTITTLNIDTKKPLKLNFLLPYFQNQIYVPVGQTTINYIYSDFPLQEYIQILILEQNQQSKQQATVNKQKNQEMEIERACDIPGYSQTAWKPVKKDSFQAFEIPCPDCTFINYGRDKCQICESNLN